MSLNLQLIIHIYVSVRRKLDGKILDFNAIPTNNKDATRKLASDNKQSSADDRFVRFHLNYLSLIVIIWLTVIQNKDTS